MIRLPLKICNFFYVPGTAQKSTSTKLGRALRTFKENSRILVVRQTQIFEPPWQVPLQN